MFTNFGISRTVILVLFQNSEFCQKLAFPGAIFFQFMENWCPKLEYTDRFLKIQNCKQNAHLRLGRQI